VAVEAGSKQAFLGADGLMPSHHDIVEWRKLKLSEGFPSKSANAIAIDCSRCRAAGNGQTEPGVGQLVESG
jgi:hypothetical protein